MDSLAAVIVINREPKFAVMPDQRSIRHRSDSDQTSTARQLVSTNDCTSIIIDRPIGNEGFERPLTGRLETLLDAVERSSVATLMVDFINDKTS